jgi:hypothetical protein
MSDNTQKLATLLKGAQLRFDKKGEVFLEFTFLKKIMMSETFGEPNIEVLLWPPSIKGKFKKLIN